MLDMQLGEGVSILCKMYALLLYYKTYKIKQHIFIDRYFKDTIIYGLPFTSYVTSTYILNS